MDKSYNIIKYISYYFIGTVIFYFVGPIQWMTPNPLKLILYLSAILAALFMGFTFYYKKKHTISRVDYISENTIVYYLRKMLWVNLIISGLYLYRNLHGLTLSIDNIILWIMNPSSQYMDKFGHSVSAFGQIVAQLMTLGSFFLWATIPFGVIFYKKLSKSYKFIFIINVIVELLRWVAMGTNKGIIDFILVLFCLLIYKFFSGEKRISIATKTKYYIIAGVLLVGGLSYFNSNIGGRVNNNYKYFLGNLGGNQLDENNILLKSFPFIEELIVYSHSYFTQGYYGLSLGLEEETVPMYGLGNSVFIMENVQEIFNVDLFQYTYMHRIQYKGWDEKSVWHSCMLWFANDVGFIGSFFVFLFWGYYIGFVVYGMFRRNKFFFPLFCMMMQFVFYLPMNNQIFQSPFSAMGFFGLNFLLFKVKHRL